MSSGTMILMILAMAVTTYILRSIPFVFIRRKIKSRYLKSFFFYVPYAVLSAMTFPYILYSTGNFLAAAIGTAVGLIAALFRRSLLLVAVLSCVAVLIVNYIPVIF